MMKTLLEKCLCLGWIIVLVCGCSEEANVAKRTSGFDEFVPRYNVYIKNWLIEQRDATLKEFAKTEQEIVNAEGAAQEPLKRKLAQLEREREKWDYRMERGDYFRFGTPDEIPADLVWEDGMEHEEIGDPRSKKGGTFNTNILTFPPTIRPFGDNSNNGFRGSLYDEIDMPLVGLHPKSMEMIPGIAKQWAVSKDGRTVYFRLNEKATYSDGVGVKARDYLYGSYLRISDDIVNPYAKQFWRESLAGFVAYDDHTLSISIPEPQVYAPAMVGSLTPSAPHFYQDYGPDYTERYQWKFPPTTGAYEVLEEDVVKGVSVTQTRVKDWWAKDNKYYKYRFNPDRIRHTVVRDESKAFELFRAGQIDMSYLTRPMYWYEKSEMEPVYKGYIERYTFYNQYPSIPYGLYLNVSKPLLDDKNIRIGIQHAMNWQKVIDVIHRGDYKRLNAFNAGYLLYSDPTIQARPYSIRKAREAFANAGFTTEGRDGILMNAAGQKLSVSLTYRANPTFDQMLAILREEAKACGFDLRLDPNEATVDYRKVMQKQHDMTFTAWVITPPAPDYYQYFHSSNARDERGNIKQQTNNIFSWAREDTDVLSEAARNARTEEEMQEYCLKLQRIVHDEAVFVPGYAVDFLRVGSWRWVKWPDSEETRFCPPVIYDPMEAHVLWIDDEVKKETMEAMRKGKVFPEVNRIFDDYREKPKADEAEAVDKNDAQIQPEIPDFLNPEDAEVGDE
jgi:microcin C transport system substrate-binding protein